MIKPRIRLRNKNEFIDKDTVTWSIKMPNDEFIVMAVYHELLQSRSYVEEVIRIMYAEWVLDCGKFVNSFWGSYE